MKTKTVLYLSLIFIALLNCSDKSDGPAAVCNNPPTIVISIPGTIEDADEGMPGFQLDLIVATTYVEAGQDAAVYSDLSGDTPVGNAAIPSTSGDSLGAIFTVRVLLPEGMQNLTARVTNAGGSTAESVPKEVTVNIDGCGIFISEPAGDPVYINADGYTGNAGMRGTAGADPKIITARVGVVDIAGCSGAEVKVRIGCDTGAGDFDCLNIYTEIIGSDGWSVFEGPGGIEFYHLDNTTMHALTEHPVSGIPESTENKQVIVDLAP